MMMIDQATYHVFRSVVKDKYPSLIACFAEDGQHYIAAARTAAQSGAWRDVADAAHALKSSSRQIGAVLLADIAEDMETACRGPLADDRKIAESIQHLEHVFLQTCHTLRTLA